MKYKTKIILVNGEYVGYVILREETVFTTSPHKDPAVVSKQISEFINGNPDAKPIIQPRSTKAVSSPIPLSTPAPSPIPIAPRTTPTAPPRRCCGRG